MGAECSQQFALLCLRRIPRGIVTTPYSNEGEKTKELTHDHMVSGKCTLILSIRGIHSFMHTSPATIFFNPRSSLARVPTTAH